MTDSECEKCGAECGIPDCPLGWEFRIAKLELASGDVLVVKSERQPAAHAHDVLQSLVPPGVRILYIPADTELSVLTRTEIEERAK